MKNRGKKVELQSSTCAHYDAFPFDFMTQEDEARIEAIQPMPFAEFVAKELAPGASVADIGCGPGRATTYLLKLGLRVTALDLSPPSIELARRRAPSARFVRGSNLELPFADCSFDAVTSDGVIHHTPDPFLALSENVRVLKAGGALFLTVYNRHGYYYYVYTYAGPPIRAIEKTWFGRSLLRITILPVYYLAHLVKSRGKRTWYGARNFFYDYIITPRATFHCREEVEAWAADLGLQLTHYTPGPGNVHSFCFRKSGLVTPFAREHAP